MLEPLKGVNILFMSALNLSLGLRKTSLVSLLKTGEKFSSSKSRDFNSILEIILSSYSLISSSVSNQRRAGVSVIGMGYPISLGLDLKLCLGEP